MGWEETAVASLADEEGVEPDDMEWDKHGWFRNAIEVEYGRMEWMAFKDDSAAERACEEYIQDMIDTEGISLFNKDFVMQFLFVSDTDKRIIAQEDADSYMDGWSDEEIEDHLKYDREVDSSSLDDLNEKIEALEEKDTELEEEYDSLDEELADLDEDLDEDKFRSEMKRIQDRQTAIDAEREKVEDERFKLDSDDREAVMQELLEEMKVNYAEEVESRIEDDLLDWLSDLGYDLSDDLPSFVQVDEKKLIEDAIRVDGVAHFLSSYDGNELDLDGGAVAYRTN
jgi:hypothetical protein